MPHHGSGDDVLVGGGIFPTQFSVKNIYFHSNPGIKLAPSRALKNCPVGNFSEGVSLPRW